MGGFEKNIGKKAFCRSKGTLWHQHETGPSGPRLQGVLRPLSTYNKRMLGYKVDLRFPKHAPSWGLAVQRGELITALEASLPPTACYPQTRRNISTSLPTKSFD